MKKLIIRLICIMLVFIMMGFCGGCNNTEKVKIERSGIDPSLINGKRVGKEVFLSAISNTPLFSDSGASFTIEKFYARETNIQRNIKEQYEIIKIETKITEDSEQPNVISCEYLSFNEKDDGVVLKTLRKTEANEDYFMNLKGEIVYTEVLRWIGFFSTNEKISVISYYDYKYDEKIKGYISTKETEAKHIIKIENNEIKCYINNVICNDDGSIDYRNAIFYIFYDNYKTKTSKLPFAKK